MESILFKPLSEKQLKKSAFAYTIFCLFIGYFVFGLGIIGAFLVAVMCYSIMLLTITTMKVFKVGTFSTRNKKVDG